jgi:hypothetical protein
MAVALIVAGAKVGSTVKNVARNCGTNHASDLPQRRVEMLHPQFGNHLENPGKRVMGQ